MAESREEGHARRKFRDLELRVVNARGRDFRIEFRNPGGCYPYGPLYLYEESNQRWAVLGDSRIPVTSEQALRLIEIAELCRNGVIPQLDTGDLSYAWSLVSVRQRL